MSHLLLFIDIQYTDVIDILLVAYLLYAVYKLVKGTVAMNILAGLALVYFIWKIVVLLQMRMLSEIMNQFVSLGVLALIIVFQPEIRKFLLILGKQANMLNRKGGNSLFFKNAEGKVFDIDEIIEACRHMAMSKTGALLVFTRTNELENEVGTGELIDAHISAPLIESIFYKNNPLHDGAVIITGDKIKAARCVLPITSKTDFPADYGLRHRAALGISEITDALVVVVSEQTGDIAVADGPRIKFSLSLIDLKRILLDNFKKD